MKHINLQKFLWMLLHNKPQVDRKYLNYYKKISYQLDFLYQKQIKNLNSNIENIQDNKEEADKILDKLNEL